MVICRDGEPTHKFIGPVWAGLPQTAPASEWLALQVCSQVTNGRARVASDCLNVVRGASPLIGKKELGPWMITSPFAGIAKSCVQQAGWSNLSEIWKVKAHTSAHQEETDEEKKGRVGNHEADEGAKQGARRHPQAPAGFWDGLRANEAALTELWKVAGAVLPLFPVEKFEWTDKGMVRRPRQPWENRRGHCWQQRSGKWVCIRCLEWTSSKLAAQQHKQCKGHSCLEAILLNDLGHRLVLIITSEGPVVACQACWAFVATFPRLLLSPCPGQPRRGGQVAKQRIGAGKHPNQKSSGTVLSICPLTRDKLGFGLSALALKPSHRSR